MIASLYNDGMETIKTLADKAGITKAALYHRMKKLGITVTKGVTDEEANALLNYKGEKPGRKTDASRS